MPYAVLGNRVNRQEYEGARLVSLAGRHATILAGGPAARSEYFGMPLLVVISAGISQHGSGCWFAI